MANDSVIYEIPSNLISNFLQLTSLVKAIGIVAVIYVIYLIISIILERKKVKEIRKISGDIEEIKRILKSKR